MGRRLHNGNINVTLVEQRVRHISGFGPRVLVILACAPPFFGGLNFARVPGARVVRGVCTNYVGYAGRISPFAYPRITVTCVLPTSGDSGT